jgi:hypothetical protein
MDLTSPLAYLPMGDEMRRQLADAQVKRVQEFPETVTDEVNVECPSCGHEHWVTLA